MNTAEKITQKLDLNWKPHYRTQKTHDVDTESVIEVLDEERTYEPENIFQNGEKPCPEAEGYNISYQIIKDIIQRTDLKLEELPNTSKNKLQREIEISFDKNTSQI